MKLHAFARGTVAALIIAGGLTTMAGPAAALPGPIEDVYRDVVEPLPGEVLDAIEGACQTADCDGIQQEIADLAQGIEEDIEFLTEELPCEIGGLCPTPTDFLEGLVPDDPGSVPCEVGGPRLCPTPQEWLVAALEKYSYCFNAPGQNVLGMISCLRNTRP